jgi:class 3 adenylate cyclase
VCAGDRRSDETARAREIRAGCHTGEVELADNDVRGLAVHIGARVAALANASELWVSSTVKDLTAGSGIIFEDAGEHELKGVPDRWRLYRVSDRSVREGRVELPRPFGHRILSPARLPFRHSRVVER